MSDIIEKIGLSGHIVLIAHVNPDADSLGSASAMYTYLQRLGKKTVLFCATENIDRRLAFLPWFDKIRRQLPAGADLAISFDCGSQSRLGAEISCDLINFDHHVGNEEYGCINRVDTDAISTTQLLYDFFTRNAIKLNTKMATALYAGLLDDSRGFLAAETDARAFDMASQLLRRGADAALCSASLMRTMSLAAMRLKGAMLQRAALLEEGRVAVLLVDRDLMLQTGAKAVDCERALEESLCLPTVEIAVMLRENADGSLKGSLRGKTECDLGTVAAHFGGGGHRRRAGFTLETCSLETAKKKILYHLKKEIL